MKKLVPFILLLLLTGVGSGFAQSDESSIYAKSVLINQVVLDQKGYMVTYFKDDGSRSTIYVPIEWFLKSRKDFLTEDGFVKAEVVLGDDPAYPYMTVYYKNGKFHNVLLHLRRDLNDPSWGLLRGVEIGNRFDPTKEIEFKY